MLKILVTGCAGFVGSHLCERLLEQGHTVIGIDNFDPFYDRALKEANLAHFKAQPNFTFYEFDLAQKENYQSFNETVDAVIHLAAKAGVLPSLKDPEGYIDNNIKATQYLLEYMRQIGCTKLIFTSSSSVYGNNKSIPFNEADPVDRPISPYAFTKKSCELLNHSYHHLYDMDVLNLRLFTVYGPRQRPDLAIRKFVKLISADEPITMYGDGSTARDYTYVGDTVSGYIKALTYLMDNMGLYEIVNLGNHQPVELKYLINKLFELMGKTQNVKQIDMQPGDVDITYADITKATNLFGYSPQTKIDDGLVKFIDWYHAAGY